MVSGEPCVRPTSGPASWTWCFTRTAHRQHADHIQREGSAMAHLRSGALQSRGIAHDPGRHASVSTGRVSSRHASSRL